MVFFYTMSNEGETVEAVLTNNGEIIGVGTEESLKEYYPEVLEEIDLAGSTVFPGFVDSHLHLLWYGQSLARLNLNQCTSKKTALRMIKEKVAKLREKSGFLSKDTMRINGKIVQKPLKNLI